MELKISELDTDIISPNSANMYNPDRGGSKIVIIGKPGTGKCLGRDTRILMYDFSIRVVQSIQTGEWLRGDDELPRHVLSTAQGTDQMFEIIQEPFGDNYRVNREHILCLKNFETMQPLEIPASELFANQELLNSYGGYKFNIKNLVPNFPSGKIFHENIKQRLFQLRCPYTIQDDVVQISCADANESPPVYPISIRKLGIDDYFGFEIDGNGRFLLSDCTVTHNTTLITSLLYEKRNIFPSAVIMSGTEDSNGHYKKIVPSTFVFNKLDEKKIQNFITRQKIAKKHLINPWSILLLDDCTDDPKIFNKPLFQGIFKNGRHWKTLFLISLQYCMDVKPVIRTNVDGVFILRESNLRNRRSLWENYAGIIPDFSMFCAIMDQLTDNYTALYIHNQIQSNKLEECIFWYKAKPVPDNFRLGSKDFWKFHYNRYDPTYTDPFL